MLLCEHRDLAAAEVFFRRALATSALVPTTIVSDHHQAYVKAVKRSAPRARHIRTGLHRRRGETTKIIERSHVSPLPPDSLHPLAVHQPALLAQQRPDPPIPVPGLRTPQFPHAPAELLLRCQDRPRWPALGRPVLTQRPTRPAFRDPEPLAQAANGVPAAGRAHEFPRAASRSMALSRVRSATTRFSRPFSSFSRRSSLASSAFSPPYCVCQRRYV